MILGVEIPVLVSLVTALGALTMGFLAHQRGRKEIDTHSLDSHLTNLREMYKELVDDYRLEIERLNRQIERLERTINQSNERIRELENREEDLSHRAGELSTRADKLSAMLEIAQAELNRFKP